MSLMRFVQVWGSLLKPLAWQGDLCFGPSQGARVTFMRGDGPGQLAVGGRPRARRRRADRDRGVPPLLRPRDGRGVQELRHARSAQCAASAELVRCAPARLAEVEVGGERAYVVPEHLDELVVTKPTRTVRLVPGFDQFVMGPGTATATWYRRSADAR